MGVTDGRLLQAVNDLRDDGFCVLDVDDGSNVFEVVLHRLPGVCVGWNHEEEDLALSGIPQLEDIGLQGLVGGVIADLVRDEHDEVVPGRLLQGGLQAGEGQLVASSEGEVLDCLGQLGVVCRLRLQADFLDVVHQSELIDVHLVESRC